MASIGTTLELRASCWTRGRLIRRTIAGGAPACFSIMKRGPCTAGIGMLALAMMGAVRHRAHLADHQRSFCD